MPGPRVAYSAPVSGHPTPEDLRGFLQQPPGSATAGRNALILRHLLAQCPVCLQDLRDLKGIKSVLSRVLEIPLTEVETKEAQAAATRYNYDWAFARADRALKTLLARGRLPETLPKLLAELSALPEGEQIRIVRKGGRFADPHLVRSLLDRSHAIRYESPRKMLHLALLGRIAADACSAEAAGGADSLADLRSHGWRQYANALRVSGQFEEAETAFAEANRWREAGTGDRALQALLVSQLSPLRSSQGRFPEAIGLIEEAVRIYREVGEPHLTGTALIQKAIYCLYAGDAERAVGIIEDALPLIDREEDPRLLLAAHHNLARCYNVLGRPEEALAVYCNARDLYRNTPDPLILLRAIWQEGQILHEIGHLHNAEAALRRARKGFLEAGLEHEATLISKDLSEVRSKMQHTAKVRQARR